MESMEQIKPEAKASPTIDEGPNTLEHNELKAYHHHAYNSSEVISGTRRNSSMKEDVKDDGKPVEKIVYVNTYAPGYRFMPTDDELLVHYLKRKVLNEPMPYNKIKEVNLYKHNPQNLSESYDHFGENEWYFFTPRDRKYRNGSRPNRAAGTGYWKATGADRPIRYKNEIVGYRKALVFYEGKPPKGDKSNWIMHEYRVNQPTPKRKSSDDMRLDDWVLCRIYKKADKYFRSQRKVRDRDRVDYPSDVDESAPKDLSISSHSHVGLEHPHEPGPRFPDHCITQTFHDAVPEVPLIDDPSLTNDKMSFDDISGEGFHYDGTTPIYPPPVFPRENHIFRTTKYSYVSEDLCMTTFDNCSLPAMHFDYSNACTNAIDSSLCFDNIFVDGVPDDPSDNPLNPRKR